MGESEEMDHGSFRMVRCAPGYFPTPALTDMSDVVTECRDGFWSSLPMSCIKPETVDPNAGPGMFMKMMKQLFTGAGLIGIIFFILIAVTAVIAIAFSWKVYFQHRAKQNTIDHEERMDHVAKLAALSHQMTSTAHSTNLNGSNPSVWSENTSPSRGQKRRSDDRIDEDYFGDVELTPASCSEWDDYTRRNGLMMMSDAGGMTVRTMHASDDSVVSRDADNNQLSRNRRRSAPSFAQAALHRTARRYTSEFSAQGSPNEPILISTGDPLTSPGTNTSFIRQSPRGEWKNRNQFHIPEQFIESERMRDVVWLQRRRRRFSQDAETPFSGLEPSTFSSHPNRMRISECQQEENSDDDRLSLSSIGSPSPLHRT